VWAVKRIAATIAAAAFIAAVVLPGFASAAGSTTTIRARVSPRTQVTRVDEALVVRSNTGWRVIVTTHEGTSEYAGGKTDGERLEIPADTTDYWVVAE
jgi:hypothetical protein